MLEEALVVLSQALIQPTLVQHVGFALQRGALIDEHPLSITVLAFLVFERNELTFIYSAGSCFHCTLNQIQKHMNQNASCIDRNHEEYVTRVPRVDSKMVL